MTKTNHGPISRRYHAMMNGLAEGIDKILNGEAKGDAKKVGFVLLMFEFSKTEGGRVNYISNAARPDMIAAMHEWLARAEGRYVDEPTGEN